MKKPVQITIPTPCHENWQDMTPADKGRFCGACQKKVYDFTNASDREISNILHTDKNACGRFTTRQLNRDLVIPKEKSTLWMAAGAAVVSFFTLGTHEIAAQTPVPVEQRQPEPDYSLGKYAIEPYTITGKVSDETALPLPFASVGIEGSGNSVITDADGNYSIKAMPGDVLLFTFIGYENEKFAINRLTTVNVQMKPAQTELQGDVILLRRCFFGRVFNRIGNLFR
jgi:hypothetical protein